MVTSSSNSSSCIEWPDHPGYCTAIIVARSFSGTLSLLGCSFMIFIIWLYKKYHFFVQRLILWLSVAALFDAVGYLMSQDVLEENTFCIVQAFWVTFFDWSVLLWVSCITFNLFWAVMRLKKTNHLEWVYHVISWGVSLVVACIPFSNGVTYGPASLLCWVKAEHDVMRFAIWYVPLFVLLIVMMSTYIYIMFVINKRSKVRSGSYSPELERNMMLLKEEVKPLRYYPLVFMALNLFPLINRIQNAAAGGSRDDPIFPIAFLAIFSVPMQGFFNAVVYGLDKETRSKLHLVQIKMALQQRRQKMLIGEYPAVGAASTVADDTVDNNPACVKAVNLTPVTADTSSKNPAVKSVAEDTPDNNSQ